MTQADESEQYRPDPEQEAFNQQVNKAWSEIEAYDEATTSSDANEASAANDPSLIHANAFFKMYLEQRPSYIAWQAIQQALHMWTNVDDRSKHIDAAVTQIGDDVDALAMATPSAVYAYRLDGRDDEIEPLTERLLAKLDTDERRSDVLCELAENCVLNNLREEARALCERVIALDASDYAVRRCRGLLHELDNLNVGQMAPTFSAPGLDMGEVNLASLRGKAVLLDFWATWCGPCIGEFPHLRRVHEKFSGGDFTIISISLDDDCDAARKKIASERLAWTHVCEGWQESKIARLYNVMGIPSTWLIAPDGTIAAKDLRGHAVDKAVGELLGRAQLD